MAITTYASFFLNAHDVLVAHEANLQAQRAERARLHNIENPDNQVEEIGYAADLQTGVVDFVCLAFAVELYLKAVYEVLGTKRRGHHIGELFEGLPPEVQMQIFKIQAKNEYGAKLDEYKSRITVISRGFEEFRYSYEHQELSYHKGFALSMIEAMKQLISDLRKN